MPDLLSTFKDSWRTAAISNCWDVVPSAIEGNGTFGAFDGTQGVQLYNAVTPGSTAILRTIDEWNFTDDVATLHVADFPVDGEFTFRVSSLGSLPATDIDLRLTLSYDLGAGSPVLRAEASGTGGDINQIADPGDRYFRLRHSASLNQCYAETSVDGSAWTIRAQNSTEPGNGYGGAIAELNAGTEPVVLEDFNSIDTPGTGKPCCPSFPCNKQRSRAYLLASLGTLAAASLAQRTAKARA